MSRRNPTSSFDAEAVAQTIYREMVDDGRGPLDGPLDWNLRELVSMDSATLSGYQARVKLYKCAIILNCLDSNWGSSDRHNEVQVAFESLVYPNGLDFVEYQALVAQINEALRDIRALIKIATEDEGRGGFAWSINWLKTAGIEINNPAVLAIVEYSWFTYAMKALEACHALSRSWS